MRIVDMSYVEQYELFGCLKVNHFGRQYDLQSGTIPTSISGRVFLNNQCSREFELSARAIQNIA